MTAITAEQIKSALLEVLGGGATTKNAAITGFSPSPHGLGGLLSTPGLEPDIYSTLMLPLGGLEAELPVMMSQYEKPLFGIMTGQTASSGTEPTAACTFGKTAGVFKICQQTWPFGRLTRLSRAIDIETAGSLINRSEFLDHRFVGNPFANLDTPVGISPAQALRNKYAKTVLEMMTALARDYAPLTWTGNPANTTGSTGYVEFNGLERLVRTGYQDAVTGTACPAADSMVVSGGSAVITTAATTIVRTMVEMFRDRMYLAKRLGLSVDFAWVMRYGTFQALTEVWPCVYNTYRCTTAAPVEGTAQVVIDGRENSALMDAMRNGSYLMIDGVRVRVILDDAMPETIPVAGTFETDIFLVPLRVNGEPVLYWEHFNYRGPEGAQAIIEAAGMQGHYSVTPDGRFLIHKLPPTATCIQWAIWTRKRLILRTPFLAARLDNVRYVPLYHERGYDPADQYYFVNGGAYTMDGYAQYFYPNFTG